MITMRPPQHGQAGASGFDAAGSSPDIVALRLWGWHAEQLSDLRDVAAALGAREQPIVADAMEALREHVDQEAADELVRAERHGLEAVAPLAPVILVRERHSAAVGRDQPAVRHSDP